MTIADTLVRGAYGDAIDRLFARRAAYRERRLDRTRMLLRLIGEPHRSFPAIHVTGTNGKTTTARMLSAVLTAHGVRSGTFTSPHLQDVRERVRVDGIPIPPATLFATLAEIEPALAAVARQFPQGPTFFETMTAVAARHFLRSGVECAVLEVGIGGRLDATNVVDASTAVIGTVARDHPEIGPDLAAIAHEKAGVIKDGAIAVAGPQHPVAERVIDDTARRRGARVLRFGTDIGVSSPPGSESVSITLPSGRVVDLAVPLHGRHQIVNAALALAAAELHLGELRPDRARAALTRFRAPGRCEVVERNGRATIRLDGAHNAPAAEALADDLRQLDSQVTLVIGALADKEVERMVAALAPIARSVVVCPPPSPRAATVERLARAVRLADRHPFAAGDTRRALDVADHLAGPGDLIVVTGSVYTVGAARDALDLPVV